MFADLVLARNICNTITMVSEKIRGVNQRAALISTLKVQTLIYVYPLEIH